MTDERKWHERTSTLAAASVAALAAIVLIVWGSLVISRQFTEPDPAPLDFVTPTFSDQSTASTTTTTPTITTTSPIVTTDIDGPSSTTSSTTSTSTSPSQGPQTRRRTTENQDDGPQTTRSRPRLNETRTLYPRP